MCHVAKYSPAKTGEYLRTFPNFQTKSVAKEYLKDTKHNDLDIICSSKLTVFQERSLRKTVSFEEQIMSVDKYSRIFSC